MRPQSFRTPLQKMKWVTLSKYYQHRLVKGSLLSKHAELHQCMLTRACCIAYCVMCYCNHIVMETHREQCTVIKFCFKLKMNGADTYKMMKTVYGGWCLSRAYSNIFEWFGKFQEGCKSMEDEARAERPRTSQTVNIECVCAALNTDWQIFIRMLTDDLNINKETIWQIITEDLEEKRYACISCPTHWPGSREKNVFSSVKIISNRVKLIQIFEEKIEDRTCKVT